MNSALKKIIRTVHLWLGLTTGIVVFIVCITGVIYTFQKELKLWVYPHYTVAVPIESSKLSLDDLLQGYQQQSDHKVLRIYDFNAAHRSALLLTTKEEVYYYIFLNPYTGSVLYETPLASDFFTIVLYLHMNLILGELGAQIVGWSVLVFILSLISGLVLWFPKRFIVFKNKKGRTSSFSIKTNGSKKRLLYDLHKVVGFYGASILIVLAITGVAWTFTWVDTAIYTAVTFERKKEEQPVVIDTTQFRSTALAVLKKQVIRKQKDSNYFIYFLPNTPTDPLWVRATPDDDQYGTTDDYYATPDTGVLITAKLDKDKNAGQKLNSLYYDIHTGSLLGIGGKIIVFLAGIIGASLPITGFLLYRNRRKKKKGKEKKKIKKEKEKRRIGGQRKNEENLVIRTTYLQRFCNGKVKSAVKKPSTDNHQWSTTLEVQTSVKNDTEMKNKIAMLWLFLGVGFLLHHVYGLAGIYFGKDLVIEGATGTVPDWAHYYRVLFELIILIFALGTLEVEKKWFKLSSFIWSILLGVFNAYHIIEALLYESSNYSEIVLLVWMLAVSVALVFALQKFRKLE